MLQGSTQSQFGFGGRSLEHGPVPSSTMLVSFLSLATKQSLSVPVKVIVSAHHYSRFYSPEASIHTKENNFSLSSHLTVRLNAVTWRNVLVSN